MSVELLEGHSVLHLTSIAILLALTYFVVTILFPPLNFPKNIPTVPFYVSFLGTYTNMDQRQIYELYLKKDLEKYGAVKIYFASRWNILVTRPEYLAQMFKDETTFAKSGNQKKIPYAVLSEYTGDNVISAHGEVWKLYRSVITHGIQFPDTKHVFKNTQKLVELLDDAVGEDGTKTIAVGDYLQRFALANIGDSMLGVDFKTMELGQAPELHQRLKFVKSQIFKPFYLNFPFFDRLPIPSRNRARQEVHNFRKYFTDQVKQSQRKNPDHHTAGYKLYEALQNGQITEKQFADNAVIILVAGHENPQLFLTTLLYIFAKYPDVQSRLRKETSNTADEELDTLPYLTSVLYEALRMYPPLGQIINRRASRDAILGSNIRVPKGAYLGYNNFATGRDSRYWPDPNNFKPERWGSTLVEIHRAYKLAKSNSTLPSFHGGKRACLGEKFALLESRVFTRNLLANFQLSLDPTWIERITPAGPICPFMLRVRFEKRANTTSTT